MIGMMRDGDGDGGQAIVVVAFGAMVLMSALAFVVDWGQGLALRRVSQNEADAAALAAGRLLATSVNAAGDFRVMTDEVCRVALDQAQANATLGASAALRLEVSFIYLDNGAAVETTPTLGSGLGCSGDQDDVPPSTVYVRVHAETTYSSFFGALLQQTAVAGASARVRITGAAVATPLNPPGAPRHGVSGATSDGPILWPLTRQFVRDDFTDSGPCGSTCDPNTVQPLRFLDPANRYGSGSTAFFGLLDLSRTSRLDTSAPQLLTSPDQTGPKVSLSPACPSGNWDTSGDATSTQCDVANWFGYGFGGMLGLDSSWTGQPDRSLDANRLSCADARYLNTRGDSAYLPIYSCDPGSPSVGDWVETAPGRMTTDIANRIGELIDARGQETAHSGDTAELTDRPFGKALVVRVFLWDCAQTYDRGRSRWTLIGDGGDGGDGGGDGGGGGGGGDGGGGGGGGDCSALGQSQRPDRVHLLTVVPFTFYQGLVTPTQIWAYWGDAFSDPGACRLDPRPGSPSCPAINAAANAAFLVPDE